MRGQMSRREGIRYALTAFLLVVVAFGAHSQSTIFGKNKVQYKKFEWNYIRSDHFDIYFSDGGEYLAEFVADAAESAYVSISTSFRYKIVNRVPWVVYNSHNDFQQTNVVGVYLEEGIGGVTELFKNRIVIPFEGDYKKFRHVIHHELVHAVLNDMFYGGSLQSVLRNNITLQLPGWFNEGLAEYEALKWDTNSDMFLRDATIHDYLPQLQNLDGYFAYRGGQSLWWYIARKYGEQKIGEILNRVKSTRSIEGGFKGALGLTLEELSERWQKDARVLFWPDIAKREEPAEYSRRLSDHRKTGVFYYGISPAISPQGDKIAFLSNRNDYFDLFLMNAIDGTVIKKLVDGQQTSDFEELKILTPAISWSPDGKKVVLATKAGEEDAILIVDIEDETEEKLTFGLDGIFSVDWSHQGDKLAFVGIQGHQSDVFVYHLGTRELQNLTNDIFSDADPVWSPDGGKIFFSSDRGGQTTRTSKTSRYDYSQQDLYSITLESLALVRLTDWVHSDESSTVVSPDGKKVLFVSDRNGINNVYLMDLETGISRPITNSLSGIYQLSLSKDGSKLAFSSLNHAGYNLFLMSNPFGRDIKVTELEPTEFRKLVHGMNPTLEGTETAETEAHTDTSGLYGKNIQIDFSSHVFEHTYAENVPQDSAIKQLPPISNNLDENGKYKVYKYKLDFSPDVVYGNAGYDTFYGVTGSTIMAFSDLLGNHQIILGANLLLDLKNSDFGIQYFYLPNRIDYGFSGFQSARSADIYGPFGVNRYRFRTYGAAVQASYPVDKFNRIDFGLNWFNISKENIEVIAEPVQRRSVILPSVGYTHDNSLWGFTAPFTGTRYSVNMFGTPRIGSDGLSFMNVMGDYRTYLRLGRYYSIALRLAGGGSFGRNEQKFIIGGVDNWINRTFEGGLVPLENAEDFIFLETGVPLRGYNYNTAIGSRYGLMNFELRYPLFAFLQAGPLPIGLQSISGAMFFDMGAAWTKEKDFVAFTRNEKGSVVTRDLLMGMGTGARIFFLAFLVRLDVAWAWNVDSFSPPKYYISMGADF